MEGVGENKWTLIKTAIHRRFWQKNTKTPKETILIFLNDCISG